jgi:carbon storage regulator CsrA
MLVLTRKPEEKIIIGKKNQIVITILKIKDGCVSIGIEADADTPIYREELLKNKKHSDSTAIDEIETSVQKFQIDVSSLQDICSEE